MFRKKSCYLGIQPENRTGKQKPVDYSHCFLFSGECYADRCPREREREKEREVEHTQFIHTASCFQEKMVKRDDIQQINPPKFEQGAHTPVYRLTLLLVCRRRWSKGMTSSR